MKSIKIIIYVSLLTVASFSQNPHNWHYCGTLETPVNINALYLYGDSSIIAATVRHEMYISHNNGTTWDTLTNKLPGNQQGVKHLEMVNSVLYACYLDDNSGTGIWKSLDTGKTWEGTHYPGRDADGFTWFGDYIFASNSPVHRSADSGRTWESFALPTSQVCMALDHLGDTLYAATYNGMYWSLDTAKTWNPLYGAGNAVGFVTLCSIGDILMAGREDGIIRSENRGINWNKTYSGGYSFCFTLNDSLIYLEDGIHYKISSDTGKTWQDFRQYDSTGSQMYFDRIWTNSEYYFLNGWGIFRQKKDDSTNFIQNSQKIFMTKENISLKTVNRNSVIIYSNENIKNIKVFAVNGREIKIKSYNNKDNQWSFRVDNIPNGIYLLTVLTEKNVYNKKLYYNR